MVRLASLSPDIQNILSSLISLKLAMSKVPSFLHFKKGLAQSLPSSKVIVTSLNRQLINYGRSIVSGSFTIHPD